MTQGTFSGLITVFLFVSFIVGVFWAFSSKRKAEFDFASQLPLQDDPEAKSVAQREKSKSSENTP